MSHPRIPLIDGLKVGAAQLIVWHHLAAYGPLSEAMAAAQPEWSAWLYDHARKAVQVFLVMGGFLAAGVLLQVATARDWARRLFQRYLRLVPPFMVAMGLAAATAYALRAQLSPDLTLESVAWSTWLAHALLLHDVVDVPAFAAGAWYVAIDFQLYVLLATVAWLAGSAGGPARRRAYALAVVVALALASLLHINRDPDYDLWALYFIGSYGLGVLAAQARPGCRGRWWVALAAIGVAALAVEWRDRIALSVLTALALAAWARPATPRFAALPLARGLGQAADRSYALFLTHYTAVLAGNAAMAHWPALQAHAWAMAAVCWLLSLALAWGFHRWVERPLGQRSPR